MLGFESSPYFLKGTTGGLSVRKRVVEQASLPGRLFYLVIAVLLYGLLAILAGVVAWAAAEANLLLATMFGIFSVLSAAAAANRVVFVLQVSKRK